MSIYHCSVKVGSRSKGQSAVAASAYRSGSNFKDYETGIISDYTRKGGIVHSEVTLCANAPSEYSDRETLWNSVHKIEKQSNAQLWREIEVALPRELNREQQIETVRDYVKGLTDSGMCADWSLHDKGDGNPHAHIMLTMRSILENGEWASKSRKVYDLDKDGNKIYQKTDKQGRKQYKSHKENYNNWNEIERIEEWRAKWADCCNERLTEKKKIDHRSYERQGIEAVPTIHEGVAARQIEARGSVSERIEINNEVKQRNGLIQQLSTEIKAIAEEIKKVLSEKGSEVSDRLKNLFERRRAAVQIGGAITDGERNLTTGTADEIIRQSEALIQGSGADRKARDNERERQAAAELERAREKMFRARERSQEDDFEL
jgi:ElaB/YqjD/DUF883 family membrane-anchored ribosome-binding protein